MEQDHTGENGVKDGNGNNPPKMGTNNNPRSSSGQTSGATSLAMKIPNKQPPKPQPKKGRTNKNGNPPGREGAVIGINFNQNGGTQQSMKARESRKPPREEKPAKRNALPISQNVKSRSHNSSRSSSLSPVNQIEEKGPSQSEDSSVTKSTPAIDVNDVEASTQNLKQLLSLGQPKRIIYSRIQLLNISENPSSKHRPDCLEKDFDATNGRWDPENWHRSLSSPPPSAGEKVRKFSFSESRDRFQDDVPQSDIILGPQRRSFQDGCHVTNSTRLSKLHAGSPTEPAGVAARHARPRLVIRQRSESTNDYEGSTPPNRDRQIESASAIRTDEFDWDRDRDRRFRERDLSDLRPEPRGRGPRDLPRDLHELRNRDSDFKDFRERDFRDKKFSHQSSREFGGGWYQPSTRPEPRQGQGRYNEPEPEWYTAGPTSKSDTIELGGFDDAPADFSSWGGEIPMDDMETNNKGKQEGKEEEEKGALEPVVKEENVERESGTDKIKEEAVDDQLPTATDKDTSDIAQNIGELDFNDLLGIPGFSSAMEQILKENSSLLNDKDETSSENQPQVGASAPQSASSRFSQWFQKEQKEGSGSRGSTPHEELENLAELAAERGLASPVDVESKHQQGPMKNDIMRLLSQNNSGNVSPHFRADVLSLEQQQLAKKLLLQQMKSGSVLNVAELEAKVGARQEPQVAGYNEVQNTAFNRLVASIREKDKLRQQQMLQNQQAAVNQFQMKNQRLPDGTRGTPPLDMKLQRLIAAQASLEHPGARIPSPEELAAHTQNIYQQALIKKQLEKQKDAYREKIRQIEQQRREDQLREAIRSADAKLQESKQMNKSLAFMPTSVMRKMQESRDGKMQDQEMFGLQQMAGEGGTHPDALASATASFSVKLANSGKKPQQNRSGDLMTSTQGGSSDLLARIYQSASLPQQAKGAPRNLGHGDNSPGLRRNASYPDALMDSNKVNRSSAFHQPIRQTSVTANSLDLSKANSADAERLRSLLASNSLKQQATSTLTAQQAPNSLAADYYNNNLMKAEAQKPNLAGKFDQSFGKSASLAENQQRKPTSEPTDELKNQQEVAILTQAVLFKFGITEDQLSRLTPQQQQTVVSIVQEQYYHLQVQKQRLLKAQKEGGGPQKMKQGELPGKQEPPTMAKPVPGGLKLDQDPRTQTQGLLSQAAPKPTTAQISSAAGAKLTQPMSMSGVTATIPGLLHTSNPHMNIHPHHPLQLRPLVPPPMAQFMPPPMARGPAMIPAAFLPPHQTHMQGRLMGPPPPPNMPLASHLGQHYPAAALMQMQLYQQQQQRALMAAAAIQQQQMAHQALAAARQQQQQNMKNSRMAQNTSEGNFTNPLERWFGRDVLSQSQIPSLHQKQTMTLSDIERANLQKQE